MSKIERVRKQSKIKELIIHCSDSTWGSAIDIDRWHRRRGWSGIGYHYIVGNGYNNGKRQYNPVLDGNIETGRHENVVGAHVKGHNSESLGICLIGKGYYTESQMVSVAILVHELLDRYNLPTEAVKGHYEFNKNKTCPMIDMKNFREALDMYYIVETVDFLNYFEDNLKENDEEV